MWSQRSNSGGIVAWEECGARNNNGGVLDGWCFMTAGLLILLFDWASGGVQRNSNDDLGYIV